MNKKIIIISVLVVIVVVFFVGIKKTMNNNTASVVKKENVKNIDVGVNVDVKENNLSKRKVKIAHYTKKCKPVLLEEEIDCLVLIEDGKEEMIYETIKGFDYKKGYEYEIVVKEIALCDLEKNPLECPQDAGIYEYVLDEIISEKKIK